MKKLYLEEDGNLGTGFPSNGIHRSLIDFINHLQKNHNFDGGYLAKDVSKINFANCENFHDFIRDCGVILAVRMIKTPRFINECFNQSDWAIIICTHLYRLLTTVTYASKCTSEVLNVIPGIYYTGLALKKLSNCTSK